MIHQTESNMELLTFLYELGTGFTPHLLMWVSLSYFSKRLIQIRIFYVHQIDSNFFVSFRAHATGGWAGGPLPLHFSAEQKTFVAEKQKSLKTRLGRHFLESQRTKIRNFPLRPLPWRRPQEIRKYSTIGPLTLKIDAWALSFPTIR